MKSVMNLKCLFDRFLWGFTCFEHLQLTPYCVHGPKLSKMAVKEAISVELAQEDKLLMSGN
jgi:hypothetical protein